MIFKEGQKFKDWTLESPLGSGGNGEVWSCRNSVGSIAAIKFLKRVKPKSYARFIDEITVIEQNSDISGILPVIDSNLPTEPQKGSFPFYVMPRALPLDKKLNGLGMEEKVNAIIQIAQILSQLHERGISHRDIKPANILYDGSNYVLADFGLADFPDKKDISSPYEEIGARWTVAPEMRRNPSTSDGKMADIYSLAKTLWIMLTGMVKGFDGQYSENSSISLGHLFPRFSSKTIDDLLHLCTDHDPKNRPTACEFIDSLKEWKKVNANFYAQNMSHWEEIHKKLFNTIIPKRVIWDNLNDINDVLKVVCNYDQVNHMFFPTGGGMDLKDVRLAYEKGCLELDFGSIHIIKPKRLLFESFNSNPYWNYFRLELEDIEPSQIYEVEHKIEREFLSELAPGEYYAHEVLENRYSYQESYSFTQFSRHISRWLSGAFVIFGKTSVYNWNSGTYDARHNTMTTEGFRNYIEKSVVV